MSHDEKSKSIWKKELSFRRKPDPEFDLDGGTSIWKKEIGLSRKKAAEPALESEHAVAETVVEPVSLPEPAPPALAPVEPAPVEHDWLTQPLEEVSEPPAEEPAPITLVPAADDPTPIPDSAPVLAPVVVPLPAPEPEPELELPPVAAELAGASAVTFPELPAAELPEVEFPAVEFPAADPAVEFPAVEFPTAEIPTVEIPAADAAKVPFYKKELSLKRKPRERTAKAERPAKKERPEKTERPAKAKRLKKAERPPKAERPAKVKRPKPERLKRKDRPKAEAGTKVPFYKRELKLKRGGQQWDAAEPAAESRPKLRRLPRPKPSTRKKSGAKAIVGLKIGGSQIAAARVNNNGGMPELVQIAREPLELGIVVGGELRDPEALAVALKAFFSQHNLPKRGVRLGIANNRIGVRTFDVTGINDPKQLANAIRFRAQEVLPIPIEEAVLDYQVLSEWTNEEGQPVRRVLLVVAYRELVDRYVYACRKAGIQVVGIDLEAFALLRAVSVPHDPVPGAERGAVVAVSVGHDRSTFAVSDGRVCEFTRVLEWGGWSLNIAIARALDMSPSEAEPIKRALSLDGLDATPEGFGAEQIAAAREAAKRQLQTFARELVSSLQFYQNQPGSLGIGEIALTGGTAHMPGLGAELERLIGVPVRVADPLSRVKVSKKVRDRDQVGSLAIAIGLGIED